MSESSTGLDPKVGGLLCYLLGIISGIAFLILEKEDRDIRFHAYQSIATFGGIFVLSVGFGWVPLVGWMGQMLLGPIAVILWVVLMVKAYQGERFKLPVIGDWAEEQL
ncbi:MAG: hypothetical protein HKP30_04170 [Myxococcales bacterium]|nr:hypothetical protein [Myxococcales bacterium]